MKQNLQYSIASLTNIKSKVSYDNKSNHTPRFHRPFLESPICPDQEALLQPQHYTCRVEVVEVIGRRRQIACSLFFPNKIFTQAPELSSTVSLVTTGETGNITHTLRHALFLCHAQLPSPFSPACINSPLPSYRGEFLSP